MSFHLRPVSLIAAGIVALAAGCTAPDADSPQRIVLNPPVPVPARRVVARRPPPAPAAVAAPAVDDTGLTQAQKDELFQRFVDSRGREVPQ